MQFIDLPFDFGPDPEIRTKRCNVCGEEKPLSEFYDRSDHPEYKKHCCKSCHMEAQRKNRKANPQTDINWRRVNRYKVAGWAHESYEKRRQDFRKCVYLMLSTRRGQCRRKGIPYTMTIDDIEALFEKQGGKCAITGRDLLWGQTGRPRDGMSVDRIDGPLGYIPSNIRLVTDQANLARNRYSDEELYAFCEAALANRDKVSP